jgi:O-antigen ligase
MVAPAYLFACLLLGGSAQGIWQNALLQLAGVVIIAWAAAEARPAPVTPSAKQLLLIALAAIALIAVQLVPLPPSIWAHGPRVPIAESLRLLGDARGAMPLTLAPYSTLSSLLALIPPLAMLCAILGLKAFRLRWLAAALLAGAFAGILLGALQVTSAEPDQSPWYLYRETNWGAGVGFFANANHMATLLVISLPFLAALAAAGRSANLQRYSALLSIIVGAVLVLVVGIALNGSIAGYVLALPVAAASTLIVIPRGNKARGAVGLVAALLLAGGLIALATSSISSSAVGKEAATSAQSREEIFSTTARAIGDFMPWGSGLGTFRQVYPMYELLDQVTPTYVVHAHNDYAEIALEAGIPGIVLVLLFLAWWRDGVWRVWRTAEAGPFARAATIASAAILVHSVVDFPLRTAAVSAAFAMCLALIADYRAPQPRDETDFRPTRHVVLR